MMIYTVLACRTDRYYPNTYIRWVGGSKDRALAEAKSHEWMTKGDYKCIVQEWEDGNYTSSIVREV